MQENVESQHVPLKVYRSEDRLTIAAPMPGLEPEDIVVEVTADGRLILDGALRGTLKGLKELLVDEWSVGGYHRELALPVAVNADLANLTYGNGVLVIAFPIAERTRPAVLGLATLGHAHGLRAGNAGHGIASEGEPLEAAGPMASVESAGEDAFIPDTASEI